MTLEEVQTLEEAFDEALEACKGAKNRDVVNWIRMYRRTVFDFYLEACGTEGMEARLRNYRKHRDSPEAEHNIGNLCLDFGLPEMDLDSDVSIPQDMNNVLYGPCEWKQPDDATIPHLEKHVMLLRAQSASNLARADSWDIVIAAARRVAKRHGQDVNRVTIARLRELAREDNE